MKLYRIYTENKNRSWIEKQASRLFSGFSVVNAIGYWEGSKEKSLIIEIIAGNTKGNKNKLAVLKDLIKRYNQQESVLLTECEIKVEF